MLPFTSIGIVAGLFFGLLSLGAAGELYYLVCWRRKTAAAINISNNNGGVRAIEIHGQQSRLDYFKTTCNGLFCWSKPSPVHNNVSHELGRRRRDGQAEEEEDLEMGCGGGGVDLLMVKKSFVVEEGVEAELMRIHNLCGPPRFLFTIKEETLEDLASDDDDGKSTRLIDLMRAADNSANFLSPVASPVHTSSKTCRAALMSTGSLGGFSPLSELAAEAEMNRVRSSPPPTFQFLRDAEEKLYKKMQEEAAERGVSIAADRFGTDFCAKQSHQSSGYTCSSNVLPPLQVISSH